MRPALVRPPDENCRPMRSSPRTRALLGLIVCAACTSTSLKAQPPAISAVSPLAVRPGQTQEITIRGGALAGASQLWTSFPSEAGLGKTPKNGTNPGEVT